MDKRDEARSARQRDKYHGLNIQIYYANRVGLLTVHVLGLES